MKIWHQNIIHILPDKELSQLHRDCCSLRGKAWGKDQSLQYIFDNGPTVLYRYHIKVIKELHKRHYNLDNKWLIPCYRGLQLEPDDTIPLSYNFLFIRRVERSTNILYKEHTDETLQKDLEDLIQKLKVRMCDLISLLGTGNKSTINVSQQLDEVIVMFQKLQLNKMQLQEYQSNI